ncbi:MAG: TonB-dependent receptor plug domain-containing protein [Endomicrobiales bacterium]
MLAGEKTMSGMRFTALVTVLALAATCVTPSFAWNMRREELVLADIPVVYTAARVEQPITEAPSTIDVITAREIEGLGLRTLSDALRLIPGIDITDIGYAVFFAPRGWNGRQFNNTTLCLLDGHPFNEVIGGHIDPLTVPLANVERIEIIKGPGSSLYGANALAGVINVITKTPKDVSGLNITAGAGNQGIQKQNLLFGAQQGDLGGMASFWHYKTLAYGDHKINDNDDRDDVDAYAKVQYGNLALSAEHYRSILGMPGALSMSTPRDRTDFIRDYASLDYTHPVNDAFKVMLRTHFMATDQRDDAEDIDPTSGLSNMIERKFKGERVGAELQSNYRFAGNNLFIAGAEWRQEKSDSDVLGGNKLITDSALYVQDEWKPVQKLILTAGGRFDKPSVYREKFSPRVSVVYMATDKTTFKTSYGEAYRAPNFIELYSDWWLGNGWLHIQGDPALQPESITTYEIGLMHSFTRDLKTNVNLFYNDLRDRIIPDWQAAFTPGGPNGMYINRVFFTRKQAESLGGELTVKYHLPFVDTNFGYSYENVKDLPSETELAYAPRHKFNLGFAFDLGRGVTLNTLTYFIGKSTYYTTEENLLSNARLAWQVADSVGVSVTAFNVFNEKNGIFADVPLAGRTLLADVSYRFGL